MDTRDERIGKNILSLRGGMSQKEVAEKMAARGWKWSQATVWSVEAGKRPIKFAEAVDICWIFGVQLSALEGDSDEMQAVIITGKYFQAIDDMRDALSKSVRDQVEWVRRSDSYEYSRNETRDSVTDAIRSDNTLDAAIRMFSNVAQQIMDEAAASGSSIGPHLRALFETWSTEIASLDIGKNGQHSEAP